MDNEPEKHRTPAGQLQCRSTKINKKKQFIETKYHTNRVPTENHSFYSFYGSKFYDEEWFVPGHSDGTASFGR